MENLGRVDVLVIGAGVIGLAVARAIVLAGRSATVVESAPTIGEGTSSRNSEVVHAGLYYPPGSLKARLCVEGRDALYKYCEEHGVSYRRIGKLVVATDASQVVKLKEIAANALACGVHDTQLLSASEAQTFEPQLNCVAALHSPSTGIIDSHALMLALQGDAQSHGAVFAFNTRVEAGSLTNAGVELILSDRSSGERFTLAANKVVNAAGLHACDVAASIEGFPKSLVPRSYFARGCYFALRGKSPFSRLIYPIPAPGGLGVHLTLDLAGRARFGPDVEWIDDIDYRVDPRRAEAFYGEIRRYWTLLENGSLSPDYAGVRPKISGPNEPPADFRIDGPQEHGVRDFVNLLGIESPGLTACLAIAELAQRKLFDEPPLQKQDLINAVRRQHGLS